MRLLMQAVFMTTLLLHGCGEKITTASIPAAALTRPTLSLDAKSGRMLVPRSALVERGGVPGVLVLTDGSHARFRMVRIGKSINDRAEILSGLHGSEILVMGDLRDVRDGSPIQSK